MALTHHFRDLIPMPSSREPNRVLALVLTMPVVAGLVMGLTFPIAMNSPTLVLGAGCVVEATAIYVLRIRRQPGLPMPSGPFWGAGLLVAIGIGLLASGVTSWSRHPLGG